MGACTGGYRCRVAEIRGATWDDLEAVATLLAPEVDLEQLRRRWRLPAFELGSDTWVMTEDGRIVAYADVGPEQELTLTSEMLLEPAEQRARARGFDALTVTATPERPPAAGFELDREIRRMWRRLDGDLAEPRWRDGLHVRTYEHDDARAVHALLDECYSAWDRGYVAREHDDWVAFMTAHNEFDPALWFLVERDGELVACALHWRATRGSGWVKDIVVRASERGRGIGSSLLRAGFRAYAERDATRVGLKVDANNPTGALQLYERKGFVTDRRYGMWTKRL
jgi:ribosomal protein S18 acetylase RimI-like enzyme